MKLLKLKAKVYQYTGLYLAKNEECSFLKSPKFWRSFNRIQDPEFRFNSAKANVIVNKEYQHILLYKWRTDNGFMRPVSKSFKLLQVKHYPAKPPVHLRVFSWCEKFLLQLKHDLKNARGSLK